MPFLKPLLISASTLCEVAPEDQREVERIVSWQSQPFFPAMGRSAWYKLREPATALLRGREVPIRSLKIKGVGLRDHRGMVCQPSAVPYERTIAHLNILESGELQEAVGSQSPMGGISLDRAVVEYHVSTVLALMGCACQLPVSLFCYEERSLCFSAVGSAPMPCAVIVAAYPNDHHFRADIIARYPFEPEDSRCLVDEWALRFSVDGEDSRKWLALMAEMWYLYGQNLRRFHEAGYYRHNASPNNYSYCSELQSLFFIDLDSARSLAECSELLKPLQILRDISSACFQAMLSLLSRDSIRHLRPAELLGSGILEAILCGYFFEVERSSLGPGLHSLTELLRQNYERLECLYRRRPAEEISRSLRYQEYMFAVHKQKRDLVDRPATCARCMSALWEVYARSNWQRIYPQRLSKEGFDENVAQFTADRVGD